MESSRRVVSSVTTFNLLSKSLLEANGQWGAVIPGNDLHPNHRAGQSRILAISPALRPLSAWARGFKDYVDAGKFARNPLNSSPRSQPWRALPV